MLNRTIYFEIWNELARSKSMVFMAGPRQAGKTTLARMISDSYTNSIYTNWDIPGHRVRVLENPVFFQEIERKDATKPLVIFDEIHKFKDWKNYLKGVYDGFHGQFQFLVSGSGRLDIYQKGGDSLAGRYFLFHLWPLTMAEFCNTGIRWEQFIQNPLQIHMEGSKANEKVWAALEQRSGFPEPYLSGKKTAYRRWSTTYSQQLIREDIRDLTDVKSIGDMETLYHLLPSKIGSPLSANSLSNDLRVAYNSVRSWLTIFERFFLVFHLSPWTHRIARAIQKEQKFYLWDTPRIKDDAARFENMVACELHRAVSLWNDMGYGRFSLHFIKNKEKEEVDFLIADDNSPVLLVEAKLSDAQPSKALVKFQKVLNIPAVQLIREADGYRLLQNGDLKILVAPAWQWLSLIP